MITKQNLKEIFEGIFSVKKLAPNTLGGLGLCSFSLVWGVRANISMDQNILIELIKTTPVYFCISFIVGFIWMNALIKEANPLTWKKYTSLIPFIIIWMLSSLLESPEFWKLFN
jgi:hypothetical protein